jgi:general secretion pathway protein B
MSLILDALNRAENERKNQNLVPDLSTLHTAAALAPAESSRQKWWLITALVGIVIAMLIAIIFLLRKEPVTALATTAPAAQQTLKAAPSVRPTEPNLQSPPNQRVDSQKATEVIAATVQQPEIPTLTSARSMPAANADVKQLYDAESQPAPVVNESVSELYAAEPSNESETIVDPFNSAASSPVQSAQVQAPARTFASIKNIPDFNELPWNMRQKIPTITYQRHNFLADGISSVVINNQTSGVGNIIAVGQFIVQDIYVDGVILKHGNSVFKLRALNGWINM